MAKTPAMPMGAKDLMPLDPRIKKRTPAWEEAMAAPVTDRKMEMAEPKPVKSQEFRCYRHNAFVIVVVAVGMEEEAWCYQLFQ
jgi:ureidoglycolate hydrolase